jgi:hypothetical protein
MALRTMAREVADRQSIITSTLPEPSDGTLGQDLHDY